MSPVAAARPVKVNTESIKPPTVPKCNGSSSKEEPKENGSASKEKPKENGKVAEVKPEKPVVLHVASKDSTPQSSSTKDSPVKMEKPSFILPVIVSPLRTKSTESGKKQDSTFIKVDYLKPAKTEKTKDNVSRVLDFASTNLINGVKSEPMETVDKKPILVPPSPAVVNKQEPAKSDDKKPILLPSTSAVVKNEPIESKKESTEADVVKTPIVVKTEKEIEEKQPPRPSTSGSSSKRSSSATKSSSHHGSSSHHKSHSSSSHHKSSSHKSSHSSGSKECSRCYRRSKIKKVNVGIQVRPETSSAPKPPTRSLEFEASHRVGVNREPVTINTNLSYLKYGRFYHIEVHPNGGASIVHMYQDELDTLSQEEMAQCVDEFFELVFSEDDNGFAFHVMGVVHDAARYLPDLLEHMAENYSNLTVKAGVLGRNNDIETCTMLQYYDQVLKSYDEGTVRYGPLHQISLVGKVHEEVGGYFPDLIGKLEKSPFLKKAMPWGKMSIVQMDPRLSNDGPILWIRPGEQLIPTAEMTKTPLKRQRARINELRNLQYLPRSSEAREIMFEDRTKAHADHVGMGHERQTTAAVGKTYSFLLYRIF